MITQKPQKVGHQKGRFYGSPTPLYLIAAKFQFSQYNIEKGIQIDFKPIEKCTKRIDSNIRDFKKKYPCR